MNEVNSSVVIAGDQSVIFDLFTTPRFWPSWHEACLKVGGVTERPYQLGDRIVDYSQIEGQVHKVFWTIMEHDRPSRAVMQLDDSGPFARVTYTFEPDTEGCLFTRKLEYRAEDLADGGLSPEDVTRIMEEESGRALQQIKTFFERILTVEKIGFDA